MQINLNLSALEDWIAEVGLPIGVQTHFGPVKDLLNWLQVGVSLDLGARRIDRRG